VVFLSLLINSSLTYVISGCCLYSKKWMVQLKMCLVYSGLTVRQLQMAAWTHELLIWSSEIHVFSKFCWILLLLLLAFIFYFQKQITYNFKYLNWVDKKIDENGNRKILPMVAMTVNKILRYNYMDIGVNRANPNWYTMYLLFSIQKRCVLNVSMNTKNYNFPQFHQIHSISACFPFSGFSFF
jgi:hypothetical protein